jgi:hypothetical protein
MDPRMIPKGGSSEEFTDLENRRNPNLAGVYYHPEAKKFLETGGQTMPDGSVAYDLVGGTIQGDAFRQIGFRAATDEEAAQFHADKEAQRQKARKESSSTTTSLSSRK